VTRPRARGATERDENEQSLPFTVSERVQIGKAIENLLKGRQGVRTDLGLPDSDPEVPKRGQETMAYAAEKAGLGERAFVMGKKVSRAG
jgi:hypothetical protein